MDYLKLVAVLLKDEPPHSTPFREGMAAVLRNRIDQAPVKSPSQPGTVEDDAFFSGRMRAHNEFRNAVIEAAGNREQAIVRLQQLAGHERRIA